MWSPTWQVVGKGAWSPETCIKPYLLEMSLTQIPEDHDFFNFFLTGQISRQIVGVDP